MLIPILIILLNAKFILCENHFMATVRNLTNSTNNSNENSKRAFNNDNILIDEVKKYLNECKTDATGESRHDEGNNRNTGSYLGSHGVKSNFHNAERRSNRESGSFDDGNIDGFLTNYRNDRTNYRPKNPCADERRSYNQRSEGNNNYENYHPRSRNTNEFGRRGGENYESNRNRAYEPNLNYRNRQDYNNHEPSYRRSQNNDDFNNYDRGIEYPDGGQSRDVVRWRRQSENCVSQCVFGYMELLDESSMPSETATIKYLQDHMQNDRKRIKLVRDTRRCYAKLATTEHDDGCEFSKTLAKCLKLNIE